MTDQTQLKHFENQIRLRSLQGWAFALAIVTGVTVLFFAGFGLGELHLPAVWTSTFSIMAHGGFLQQFVVPLGFISIVLFVIAIVLHLFIDKTLKLDD
jgi:hypothetical protein